MQSDDLEEHLDHFRERAREASADAAGLRVADVLEAFAREQRAATRAPIQCAAVALVVCAAAWGAAYATTETFERNAVTSALQGVGP